MSKASDRLKQLRKETDSVEEFHKRAYDEKLTISKSQSRRYWYCFEPKKKD